MVEKNCWYVPGDAIVPNKFPPVGASYQLRNPELAVADSVTEPGPQLLPPVTEVITGLAYTVMWSVAIIVSVPL